MAHGTVRALILPDIIHMICDKFHRSWHFIYLVCFVKKCKVLAINIF